MILINYTTRLFALTLLFAMILVAASLPANASKKSRKNLSSAAQTKLWQQTDESNLQLRGRRLTTPEKYLVYRVNQDNLKKILADAPLEFSDAARNKEITLELPTPDGKTERFRIEESQVLAPKVAAQFPTWKTFIGKGIDDPTATVALDITDNGFHAYVSGMNGTYLINPYSEFDRNNYIVYYKGDLSRNSDEFTCNTKDNKNQDVSLNDILFSGALRPPFNNGTQLRTLRLAVSATKEYTNFFNGNVNTALAAIVTSVNRVNLVFRRDLAVAFQIVSDARTVFTDANNGGFPDASNANVADLSVTRNQTVIDAAYGNANYDIGHAVSRTGNPNGLAASPSICSTGNKAQGFTGAPTPQGDGYDVDYFAHELGHQFGMSHTFNNNTDGSCTTRSANSAFEPASGVTIMGYAGICSPRNLASSSIDIFHPRSLEQAFAELATEAPAPGGTCGTTQDTGNTPPVVNAGPNYTIPRLTPFTLTGSATDNTTSGLTYDWEEYDLGAPTSSTGAVDTDADGMARPIFRAYNPSTSPSRTFPSLTYILNNANVPPATYAPGTRLPNAPTTGSLNGYVCEAIETAPCIVGESLPSIARVMNFRLTVRDNFSAVAGGVADATTQITIVNTPGPFQVTTQNTAAQWQGNSVQTITWDVVNTNAAPINAANVNILLSTDGGQTFPIMLSPNTPNDGTESVTIPNIASTTTRIKIEAVGNVFFDINNVNFTVNASTPPTRALFDFDGDGRTDVSVFRPSNATWYLQRSTAGFTAVQFGEANDLIAPADFDGDGKTDIAVFRPSNGTWYRINSSTNTFSGVQFGQNGDLPRPADFDGDNRADIAVFRPSNGTWYRLNSSNGQFVPNQFGQNGDIPVPADYDGDGRANLAVFRPTANQWYIAKATGTPAQNFDVINFGATGDIPVPANYDGDTKTDVAVFRPSTGVWFRISSLSGQTNGIQFGQAGDIPVAGDYDGDGRADFAVFRPSTGAWYSSNTQSGNPFTQFGTNSDKPVPSAFNGQ